MSKPELIFNIEDCPLTQAVLETLIDEVNVMIETIVKLRAGINDGNDIFVEPFTATLETWVKEETDKERLLTEGDLGEMYKSIFYIARRFFDELSEYEEWFCYTYRLTVSVEVPSLKEKYTIMKLTRDKELVQGDISEETMDDMYMTARRVLRIVF